MTRASRARIIERMKTIGVADRLRDAIAQMMGGLLFNIHRAQHDDKERHYALFIYTKEGIDDANNVVITTDMFTSMPTDAVMDYVGDWLEMQEAARK